MLLIEIERMFIYTGNLIHSWDSIFQLIKLYLQFYKSDLMRGSYGWEATQVHGVIIELDDGLKIDNNEL